MAMSRYYVPIERNVKIDTDCVAIFSIIYEGERRKFKLTGKATGTYDRPPWDDEGGYFYEPKPNELRFDGEWGDGMDNLFIYDEEKKEWQPLPIETLVDNSNYWYHLDHAYEDFDVAFMEDLGFTADEYEIDLGEY